MSAKKESFVKQAAILAIAGLVVRFIGFLYKVPMTNIIGDVGNAIYNQGYYLYTFFLIMSSAGLPAAISKMVSERLVKKQYRNAHEIFKVSLKIATVGGLAAALLLGFGAKWLSKSVGSPESFYTILTLAPTVLIVAIMAVYRGYFQGMNNTVPTAISQLIEQIFNAVFSVFLAAYLWENTKRIDYASAGGTAGTGVGAFVGLVCIVGIYMMALPRLKKRVREDQERSTYESSRKIGSEVIRTALPIIIGTAIFSVTNLIDMKMVNSRLVASGAFTSDEIKVLYGQLTGKYVTLTTLPVAISTAMATAAVPNIAASIAMRNYKQANRKINMALRLTMMISIPAAVGMGILSDQILLLLFPKFSGGGELIKIGAISIIFLALAQICTGMLQGTGKVKVPAIAAFFGGMIKIPLNFFLISIPSINVKGAVISTITCYVVASGINLFVLSKTMRMIPDVLNGFFKPLAASVAMGLGCYVSYHFVYMLIPSNTFACIVAIVISIFIYAGYMLLMKGIDRDDLSLMPMGKKLVSALDRFGFL